MRTAAKVSCVTLLAIAGCAPSSHILIGTARPPISPAEVRIYSAPPPRFERVALLTASLKSPFWIGGQQPIDTVIQRLKVEAARLGANGVILEEIYDRDTDAYSTGATGPEAYAGGSALGVGVGGTLGIHKKTGKGTAIIVP